MEKRAHIVAGMAFGDEGKGATVDYLVKKTGARLVVRYNGGAQAAHNVVEKFTGMPFREHTFSQFGSGTLDGAITYLSEYVLVNPENLENEARALVDLGCKDVMYRVFAHEKAVVITPFHMFANRLIEMMRNKNRHGSCGQGVGIARACQLKYGPEVLMMGDLFSSNTQMWWDKMDFMQEICIKQVEATAEELGVEIPDTNQYYALLQSENFNENLCNDWLDIRLPIIVGDDQVASLFASHQRIVFEGAQGVLLDETVGTAPYNTWTDTTFTNAYKILDQVGFEGEVSNLGVFRCYFTRHGVGPFPTEDKFLRYPELHNKAGAFQGAFRFGAFDAQLAKYALKVCNANLDGLVINHYDQVKGEWPGAVLNIQQVLGVPVRLVGNGPTANEREEINGGINASWQDFSARNRGIRERAKRQWEWNGSYAGTTDVSTGADGSNNKTSFDRPFWGRSKLEAIRADVLPQRS